MKKQHRRYLPKQGEEKMKSPGLSLENLEDTPTMDPRGRFVSRVGPGEGAIVTAGPSTEKDDDNGSKQEKHKQGDSESINNSQVNTIFSPWVQRQERGMAGMQENQVKRKPISSPHRGTPYSRLYKKGTQEGVRMKELEEPDDTSPLTAVRLTTEYDGGERTVTGYNESPLSGKVFRILGAFKKDELSLDEWIKLHGGEVVDEDEEDKARFVILGDGVKRFDILNAIAREYILVTRATVEESIISVVNKVDLEDMPPITNEDVEYLRIPKTQSLMGVTMGVFGCSKSTSYALHQVIEECGGEVEDTLSTDMDLILMRKAPTKALAEGVKRFGIVRIEYEDLVKLINEETTVKMLFRKAKDAIERGRTKSHGGGKQGHSKSPGGSIMDAFARGQSKAFVGTTHGASKEVSRNTIGRGRSISPAGGNRGRGNGGSGSGSSGGNNQGQSRKSNLEATTRGGSKSFGGGEGGPSTSTGLRAKDAQVRGRSTSPEDGCQGQGQISVASRSKRSKSPSVSFNLDSSAQQTPSSRSNTNMSSVTDDTYSREISPMHGLRLKPKRLSERPSASTPPGVTVLPAEGTKAGGDLVQDQVLINDSTTAITTDSDRYYSQRNYHRSFGDEDTTNSRSIHGDS
jgi:hypothetical protein